MLTLNSCQLVQDQIHGKLAGSFNDYFRRTRNQQNYNNRGNKEGRGIQLARKNTANGLNYLSKLKICV